MGATVTPLAAPRPAARPSGIATLATAAVERERYHGSSPGVTCVRGRVRTTCATRVYASSAPVAPSTAKAVGSDSSSAGCLIRVRVRLELD